MMTTIETPLDSTSSTDLAADESSLPVTPVPGLSVYRDDLPVETTATELSPSQDLAMPLTWRGAKLHPFNSSRVSLFGQHRLAVGSPSLQLCLDDVDAFLADALRILWLCSHTPDDWAALRCSPSELQLVIDRWCDEAAFDSVAAVVLGMQIYAESRLPAPVN
jgi:hypothetical protein